MMYTMCGGCAYAFMYADFSVVPPEKEIKVGMAMERMGFVSYVDSEEAMVTRCDACGDTSPHECHRFECRDE